MIRTDGSRDSTDSKGYMIVIASHKFNDVQQLW